MRSLLGKVGATMLVVAGLGSALGIAHAADDWPKKKPITIVFPYAAGPDALHRAMAADMEKTLGQTFIVENKPGAGGALGSGYVANAQPDGYTLLVAFPGPVANYAHTYSSLPYKPLEAFEYIGLITKADVGIVARKDFPANNLEELIAYLRAHPGEVSAAHPGIGSYGHMFELMLAEKADAKLRVVPYSAGTSAMIADLLSGSVDISATFYSSVFDQHVKEGNMKLLGIASAERSKTNPDAQTFKEVGIDLVANSWSGLVAPKGTPKEIVDKLNAAMNKYLESKEAAEAFANYYQEPAPITPEEFTEVVKKEEATWRPIIEKYEIRND